MPDPRDAKSADAAAPTTDDKVAVPNAAPPAAAPSAQAMSSAMPAAPAIQPSVDLRQAQSAYQAPVATAVNLPQMAFDIVRHVQQGSSHFQIRLDPADLGRVDVKLAIDGNGTVNAHLTAERADTLDLLKRDSGTLGQALSQAGLDAGKTNLQFSLSQNPFQRQNDPASQQPATAAASDDQPIPVPATLAATTAYRGTAGTGGVNLFV